MCLIQWSTEVGANWITKLRYHLLNRISLYLNLQILKLKLNFWALYPLDIKFSFSWKCRTKSNWIPNNTESCFSSVYHWPDYPCNGICFFVGGGAVFYCIISFQFPALNLYIHQTSHFVVVSMLGWLPSSFSISLL